MYNKGLFHKWVPQPLIYLLMGILLIPILNVNGVYSGNIAAMVGGLGAYSETISFAMYASTIGMAASFPLLMHTKQYFRSKEAMVGSLCILAFLSFLIGKADDPYILVAGSFFIGFFKMFAMMELIVPIMMIFSPQGDRGRFYSFFYPISIGLGQIGSYVTGLLAYRIEWEYAYIVMTVVLLFSALVCLVFMHNLRPAKKVPIRNLDGLSLVLFSLSFLSLDYVLVYTKQQAWFTSPSIWLSLVGFISLFILFLYRQSQIKVPLISLSIFRKKNVLDGFLMILLIGLFLGTGSIQSAFTSVLKYDALTVAELNLWMIPGVVLGGFLGFQWFKRQWLMKVYVLIGFSAFELYIIWMYFLMAPIIDIEYLIFPTILKGLGMTILFIGLGFYCLDKLSMQQVIATASILVLLRSFVGTALFGSIYSWALYKLQLQHATNFASHLDVVNTGADGMSVYAQVQVQALLAAAKTLFGYIAIIGVAVLVYVLFYRFTPIEYRRTVLMSRLFSGQSIKGYRRVSKNVEREEAAAATAGAL